ncbi:MAG: pyruvate kinase [Candidatus Kapaibacterium sp.]
MNLRKTKIICTIGPSTSGVENLVKLIEKGMDAARLNFSHGSHEDHKRTLEEIREASRRAGKEVAIIQDLQGPKIRTGKVENGEVELEDGQKFVITVEDIELGNSQRVGTTYKPLIKEVKSGNTILVDDGYIILKIEKVDYPDIITTVVKGGKLSNNKGIVTPGVPSTAPTLSKKDIDDLKFGLEIGVDSVALSFVRSERDVLELKTTMKIFGRSVPVIAKIERYEGYEDMEDIISESDGIMVARGDLGLEMPAERVPMIQKQIIRRCNYYGKPVIVATQMLESMISNPRPTRAEASDVANAVLDGTDCVMLSSETSVGDYPFDAVDYMSRIINIVEEQYSTTGDQYKVPEKSIESISDALGKASCEIADQIKAAAIISLTMSGYTAANIAKYRPRVPIIALTDTCDTMRNLSYVWGVYPKLIDRDGPHEDIFRQLSDLVTDHEFVSVGDNLVYVAGLSANKVMPQNMIKVHEVT